MKIRVYLRGEVVPIEIDAPLDSVAGSHEEVAEAVSTMLSQDSDWVHIDGSGSSFLFRREDLSWFEVVQS